MTEIYLDSAATSLHKPPQVARAVAEAICTAGNAARGAHGASMAASRTVYDTRCLAARLLGCPRPDHVAFTANSTMALNMAICGLLTPEDHAISTDLEHNSVLRPLLRGGSGVHSFDRDQPAAYPTRLEAGTLNSHGLAGLHAALEYLLAEGVENLYAREHTLMRRFYLGVRDIPGVRVYGDFSAPCRAAIVSLNIRGLDSGEVSDALLQGWGIATRPGAHCAPRLHRALGTERQGIVRFSFSPFNTPQEIDTAVRAVADLAR